MTGPDRPATATATVRFRPLTGDDLPRLAQWLAAPHVHRWWYHDTDLAAVERDFGPGLRGEEPGEDLVVVLGPAAAEGAEPTGVPVGFLQRGRWDDYPDDRAAIAPFVPIPAGALTVDYFVAPVELTGRGLGPRIIAAAVVDGWRRHPDAPCVVVPVHADNRPSWRALEKAGFRLVGPADLEPDNPADDRRHVVYRCDRPAPGGTQ